MWTNFQIQSQGETILDSGFNDEVNWRSIGGSLQEGIALGSAADSYFESTITAGNTTSFQAIWDGRLGDAGGALALRLLGDEIDSEETSQDEAAT